MGQDVLTLQEVADLLGKSTQTIRRMIKKGELKAQKIRTAQGFQYGIYRGQVASSAPLQMPSQPPIQTEERAPETRLMEAANDVLTSQLDTRDHLLVTQEDLNEIMENDFYVLEPSVNNEREEFKRLMDQQHREKMLLIHILEALQAELHEARTRPQTFFAWLREKLGF